MKFIRTAKSKILPKDNNIGNIVLKPWLTGFDTGPYNYYMALNKNSKYLYSSSKENDEHIINAHTYGISRPKNIDVFTAHMWHSGNDFPKSKRINKKIIQTAKKSKRIICVSNYLSNKLTENGIQEDKIDVIPCMVDLNHCKSNYDSIKKLWYKETLQRGFTLFVGRSTYQKRPNLFIELAKRHPDREFIIIGKDSHSNKKKAPNNVYFFDHLDHNLTLGAMANSEAVIMPSRNETFGMVAIEAIAMGVPAIISDSGGQSEIPIKNKFNPDDIESLDGVYQHMLENRERIIKDNNKIIDIYSAKTISKKVDAVYSELFKEKYE